MKKMIFTLIFLTVSIASFWGLASPDTKLQTFTRFEKYWTRMRVNKPSSFIDEASLKAKITQGLPSWAQAQIQEDQVRVQSPKIDDLQTTIAFVKQKNFDVDLQFINFR